jgi:hypothetical protein
MAVPVYGEFSVTVEAGSGTVGVDEIRYASAHAQPEHRTSSDRMTLQHFQVGLRRSRRGDLVCRYVGGAAGVFRYRYRGQTHRAPGVSMSAALEVPSAGARAFFASFALSVAAPKDHSPTAGYLDLELRPVVGIRMRF